MKTIVPIAPDGSLTIPEQVREQLGLEAGGELELELVDGTVTLRQLDRLTSEEEELVRRARADVRAGRVRRMSEEDLLRFIGQA